MTLQMKPTKDRLWNPNYNKVMIANFLLFFAFYLLTPLLPIYLSETFDASKDTIGIVLSGYTLTALLIRPFSGYIVDSFPRKRVVMVCFGLFFILFGGYILASSLLLFAIIRTLHGGPFGALTVANSTLAIDVLPSSRRNEGLGYYGLSNNIAMATAPTIGIYIYKMSGQFELLFWLALLVAGIGMAVDATVQVEHRQQRAPKSKMSWDRFFLIRAWLMAINMALFSFCFGVLSNYLAIYSKEILGITGGTGTYFALLSIGLIASRLQGVKRLRDGDLTRNAAIGVGISLTGYTLFVALPNEIGYYASALLIGLGNGQMYPAFLNMFVSLAHSNERGTANSSILTAWDLGLGIGIMAGGIVSEHFGYEAAFWMSAAVNACGVLLFFAGTRSFFHHQKRMLHEGCEGCD